MSVGERMRAWSVRHQHTLLALSAVSVVALFVAFLLTSTLKILPIESLVILHAAGLVSAFFIIMSVASKGAVPIAICVIGIVLIHNAIILPLYATPETGEATMGNHEFVWTLYSPEAVMVAGPMHFFLGATMVVFGTIIAHRPSMLFTRNRPAIQDDDWSSHKIWQDNFIIANGGTEAPVPVKEIMTDQDRHLLWRYEYVLGYIYGSLYLVKTQAMVPPSTTLLRDKASGRIQGKARYGNCFL